jgi:methyl-accepting chemotaxis protein
MTQQRKQVIIKNEFQHKLILSTVLITLITLNLIILAASLLEQRLGSEDSLFSLFNLTVAGMEVVAVIVVYFVSRDISFHIAGPVYAIERTIKGLGEGNLYQVLKLRPRDQFAEVSEELNLVMRDYCARLERAKQLASEIKQSNPDAASTALCDELAFFLTRVEEAAGSPSSNVRL